MLVDALTRLMVRFGSDMTLTRAVLADPAYDPATGEMEATTPGTFTVRGVFIDYRDREIDGTLVRAGDRKLLIDAAGSDTTPEIGDRVDGMRVQPHIRVYAPNGTAIAWACQMRR